LAGSEKINKQEEMAEGHLKELKNINLSLTTLSKVIQNLKQGSKLLVPFRESKLTRILQESLRGNTRTYIICTISSNLFHIEETINTLKFAERARHIVLKVKPNEINANDRE
jgi:kinesin family protein 3/17